MGNATAKVESDVLVIGAGAIGLAIATKLAEKYSVALVEKNETFGQEISSRNSEVIHSGIYYPTESHKTACCLQGRSLLYPFCEAHQIPYSKTGKLVVATTTDEQEYLNRLAAHSAAIEVPFFQLDRKNIHDLEPLLQVQDGLYFPKSGIFDSHRFMAVLETMFLERAGMLAYRHTVTSAGQTNQGKWQANLKTPDGIATVESTIQINAAGLGAAELSNLALGTERYQHRYCLGRYFTLPNKFQNLFSHLVYPIPSKDGLGVHVTLDLDGYAKLGPDTEWTPVKEYAETPSLYDCDWTTVMPVFAEAARRYCPSIDATSLTPGLVGIRPKLYIDQQAYPDFLIENHKGFIHCLGIESPGLTSALAIADAVNEMLS